MNRQETASGIYQEVKSALNEKLLQQGYAPVHEQLPEPVFGSSFMLWSNNIEAISFAWDGKEKWYCLEITEDLPLKPLSHWDEIFRMKLDTTASINATDYVSAFLGSLE